MRKILFRGKRTDNGEWVYGFYCPCCFGRFPCEPTIISSELIAEGWWKPTKVIPETVGQFTGLIDKNGVKIFEGDIVDVNIKGNNTICKVAWAGNVAQYQLWQINTLPHTPTNINLGNYDCEVIGNIYDNPELLKV